MQLPIDAGALVTTTPGASGAQPEARTSRKITSRVILVPVDGFEPPTNGLQNRCSTTELNRRSKRIIYLMRRNVGLPPPVGFFGSGAGAGSAVGGLVVVGAASVSPRACTLGFAPSVSKVMPWPVSRAYSA